MSRILLLETSTALCSAAIAEDGKAVSYIESDSPREHASLTAVFVDKLLKNGGWTMNDIDAVCVSEGPGSYTGLRVGVSTAKGLCFGSGTPLLSVGTLEVLAMQAIEEGLMPEGCTRVVSMIDARRMEVYASVFTNEGEMLSPAEPVIVDEQSFAQHIDGQRVLFIGDGAEKCSSVLAGEGRFFAQCCPKASSMAALSQREFNEKRFKDVAYLEPFYLKDFAVTQSRKRLF